MLLLRPPDGPGVNLGGDRRNLDQSSVWALADLRACAHPCIGPGLEGNTPPDVPGTCWALWDHPDGFLGRNTGPDPVAANQFELAASVLAVSSGLLLFRRRQ